MPKGDKPPKPIPSPSEPIQKDKDKKEKDKDKIRNLKKLETAEVSATGSITAGKWVAEMDTSTIRKNTLRN